MFLLILLFFGELSRFKGSRDLSVNWCKIKFLVERSIERSRISLCVDILNVFTLMFYGLQGVKRKNESTTTKITCSFRLSRILFMQEIVSLCTFEPPETDLHFRLGSPGFSLHLLDTIKSPGMSILITWSQEGWFMDTEFVCTRDDGRKTLVSSGL